VPRVRRFRLVEWAMSFDAGGGPSNRTQRQGTQFRRDRTDVTSAAGAAAYKRVVAQAARHVKRHALA
jgi:hypothetical protein